MSYLMPFSLKLEFTSPYGLVTQDYYKSAADFTGLRLNIYTDMHEFKISKFSMQSGCSLLYQTPIFILHEYIYILF
jgi:hypothetical protein